MLLKPYNDGKLDITIDASGKYLGSGKCKGSFTLKSVSTVYPFMVASFIKYEGMFEENLDETFAKMLGEKGRRNRKAQIWQTYGILGGSTPKFDLICFPSFSQEVEIEQ